jgi:hypothetical protein
MNKNNDKNNLSFLTISLTDKVFLFYCSFIATFSYVTTPVLVRGLVDGFIKLGDTKAISLTLLILFGSEFFALLLSSFMDNHLMNLQFYFLVNAKRYLLENFFKRFDSQKYNDMINLWKKEIVKFAWYNFFVKWSRVRDIMAIFFLSIISIAIGAEAGLFILFILLFSLAITYLNNVNSSQEYNELQIQEKIEEKYLDILSQKSLSIHAIGGIDQGLDKYLPYIYDHEFLRFKTTMSRKKQDQIMKAMRAISVLGIVTIGSYKYSQGDWSMGSIWALLIVTYRIISPIQNFAKWIFVKDNSAKTFNALQKFHVNAQTNIIDESPLSKSVRKKIDKIKFNSFEIVLMPVSSREIESIITACGYWSFRVGKKQLGLFNDIDDEMVDSILENYNFIILYDSIDKKMNKKSLNSLIQKAYKNNQFATIWILTPKVDFIDKVTHLGFVQNNSLEIYDKSEKEQIISILSSEWVNRNIHYANLIKVYIHQIILRDTQIHFYYLRNIINESNELKDVAIKENFVVLPTPISGIILLCSSKNQSLREVRNYLGKDIEIEHCVEKLNSNLEIELLTQKIFQHIL